MREIYKGVTAETKEAVEPCVKEIAYEMGVEPQYLYAILSGKEPDPFKRFLRLFRAVARKNKSGAMLFVRRLNETVRESDPQPQTTRHALESAYHNFLAVLADREDGVATPEQVEEARGRLGEVTARVGWQAREGVEASG